MALDEKAVIDRIGTLADKTSTLNQALVKRIVKAERNLNLEKVFTGDTATDELAKRALDVHSKYIEFYANVSVEPLYTKDDDPDATEQIKGISALVDNRVKDNILLAQTLNLTDVRVQTLSQAIHENPQIIDVLRYFSGLGDITFELLASEWLHKEHYFAGMVRFHGIEAIKHLAGNNVDAATCIASHFVQDFHVRPIFEILSKLTDQQRIALVDLIASYQLIGHLSKKSGHKAEMIIAQHLKSMGIPFEPEQKLHTLGSPDIEVPLLGRGRLFDLVVPNKEHPKVIIECAYYNSNTGSVASKVIREIRGTLNEIRISKVGEVQRIKLVGFVDGAGWIAMSGHLIKILLVLDDFVQLSTLSKIKSYV